MKRMKTRLRIFFWYGLAVIVTVIGVQACKTYYFRSNYADANRLLHETKNLETKPFLKAHLKNGDVLILYDSWKVDTIRNIITGNGLRYDFNRQEKFNGPLTVAADSVAIYETNTKIENPEAGRIATLGILAGLDVVVGVICITVPKACFGSCPTFYINEHDNFQYADAEGFSNAISPSMEYGDIDALNNKPVSGNTFAITMKNEALETHCVNDVKLLAYPRNQDERVYHTRQDEFYLCGPAINLSRAVGQEGDITGLLNKDDKLERFSLADDNNLVARETIYLTFDHVEDSQKLGLIAGFRQTLMTTYLVYSAIGYMGDQVGDIFADIERHHPTKESLSSLYKQLGDIDVYQWNDTGNAWDFQGGWYETGPIAVNHQMMPLKGNPSKKTVKIKLVMNKGLWRLDYFALADIKKKVTPVELTPDQILNKGTSDPGALACISDPHRYLVSMPGSMYKFNFTLPEKNRDYELFLYAKGYYLEWMRAHWIKDKNLQALGQMIRNPGVYLKSETKAYKKYESQMEPIFWNSRIDPLMFSYHESGNPVKTR